MEASGLAFASERTGAGGVDTPGAPGAPAAAPARRLARWWRESPWAPLLGKAAGATALLGGLGLLGASSVGRAGVAVPLPAAASSWVAAAPPDPGAAPGHHAQGGAPAPRASAPGGAAAGAASGAPGAAGAAPTESSRARRGRRPCAEAEAPASPALLPDGRVVLNLATVDDLQRLPGVGARRAEEIVALRTRLKRFRRPADLLRVRGIGARALKRMQPHLVIDAPDPPPGASSAAPAVSPPPAAASAPAPSRAP